MTLPVPSAAVRRSPGALWPVPSLRASGRHSCACPPSRMNEFTSDPGEDVAAINKCGQAACLCTGTFCADLIDANYCSDFHCGGRQCICIF